MTLDLRYDPQPIPAEWKERIANGRCGVCGVKRKKKEYFLQGSVHAGYACSVQWTALAWTWGNFRRFYMQQPGIKCAFCRKPFGYVNEFELDHKIPVAVGGSPRALENLQPLCRNCHKLKTRLDIQNIRKGIAIDMFSRQRKL